MGEERAKMNQEATPYDRFEEILTIRVIKAPNDHIVIKCDQVRGLFIATLSLQKSLEQVHRSLFLLSKAGAKVPGINR